MTRFSVEVGVIRQIFDKINLDYPNEDDCGTIIHAIPLAWHNRFEKCKAFNKVIRKN